VHRHASDKAARRRTATEPDRETRARLLEEARKRFAADGFRNVTVREICRAANANVAAVNYHFGDKRGLYLEVLEMAIAVMRQTTEQARQAGEGGDAEHRLRAYVRVFLQRVGQGAGSWIHQMMAHEMADPTDALDRVVRDVVEPRIGYIRMLIGEILGLPPDDPRVMRCVLSVQSQIHTAMANPISERLVPGFARDPEAMETLIQHIADFSVGGIRSLKR
jgi:AcrR family transcriptional regulator